MSFEKVREVHSFHFNLCQSEQGELKKSWICDLRPQSLWGPWTPRLSPGPSLSPDVSVRSKYKKALSLDQISVVSKQKIWMYNALNLKKCLLYEESLCTLLSYLQKLGHEPQGDMICGWTKVCRLVFRKVHSSYYQNLPSYPLLWWILTENQPFMTIFHQFWTTHQCLRKICRKRDPCLENFGPQNPPICAQISIPSTCYIPSTPRRLKPKCNFCRRNTWCIRQMTN